jgi:S1-C subfamily serine protease
VTAIAAVLVVPEVRIFLDLEGNQAEMGVSLGDMTPEMADQSGYPVREGAMIPSVRGDGPASGVLDRGDMIIGIDGRRIRSSEDIIDEIDEIAAHKPGDEVYVNIINWPSFTQQKLPVKLQRNER